MPPRFICKECNTEVWKTGGNKKMELCNRCYTKYLRGEPQKCTMCGRVSKSRRKHNPICSNCEAIQHAKHCCETYNKLYSTEPKTEVEQRLKKYWWFLNESLGEREKPIYEAFFPIERLLTSGTVSLNLSWMELENFRKTQGVRFKAALHVYMNFLAQNGIIEAREEKQYNLLFTKKIEETPILYRNVQKNYIEFCLWQRNLSNWTTYLITDHLKEFFGWLSDTSIKSLSVITPENVHGYLSYLRERVSQKTVYNVKVVLDDFFKWAKQNRLVFNNPSISVDVRCPLPKPKGLPFHEQRRLLNRWMDDNCDPQESIIGMLSLFYGLSNDEMRKLKVNQIDLIKGQIILDKRPMPLQLIDEVKQVLEKYLLYRDTQISASKYEYLLFSKLSITLNQPINALTLSKTLKPANVNLRSLRATCLIDSALSGNVKVLEVLGLSIEGCKPYLNVVKDALAHRNIDS